MDLYLSLDLTRAEHVKQNYIQFQKQQLESQDCGKTYRVRRGRVFEEKLLQVRCWFSVILIYVQIVQLVENGFFLVTVYL